MFKNTAISRGSRVSNWDMPDQLVYKLLEETQHLGIEPELAMLMGFDEGELKRSKFIREIYTDSTGFLETTINADAVLSTGEINYDEKEVFPRFFSTRYAISYEVMKYGDDTLEIDEFKTKIKGDFRTFYNNLNQEGMDMILRGWETTVKSQFENRTGGRTILNNRDMEGSNPFFAPLHKIMANNPNDYRWSNVCVRRNGANYKINPPLTRQAIVDTYDYANSVRDYRGQIKAGVNVNTVICSLKNIPTLEQLIISKFEPHNANNGVNTFVTSIPGVNLAKFKRFMMDGEGNTTNPTSGNLYSDYWFMVDMENVKKEFRFQWHRKPTVLPENKTGNNESANYYAKASFQMYSIPRGYIFGSNATNTDAPNGFDLIGL